MSLVSQITAAFQAVATAMGKEQDWATSFTSKLTTPTGANAASKTVPGVVQLATTTQAIAGTDDSAALTSLDLAAVTATTDRRGIAQLATATEVAAGGDDLKIVTPAQLTTFLNSADRMRVYRVSTLAALNALAATAADGAIAQMTDAPAGVNGVVINTATWAKRGGVWYLLSGVYCGYPGTYTNGNTAAVAEVAAAIVAQPKLSIPNSSELVMTDKYRYNGNKYVQVSGTSSSFVYAYNYTQWDTDATNPGWWTRFERNGRVVTARFGIKGTGTSTGDMSAASLLGTVPVNFRPAILVAGTLSTFTRSNGWNGVCTLECRADGTVNLNWASNAFNQVTGIFGNMSWEAAD